MGNSDEIKNRRNFIKLGLVAGGTLAAGAIGLNKLFAIRAERKRTVFTSDGKVIRTSPENLREYNLPPVSNEEARKGIPGKKFVMVIDLAKCDGCKKCTEACQAMHFTESDREWIKVFKMQDSEASKPYYFPKPCYHCDNPTCTKVCPVGATFKRQDGIVLIDNERCIGCRMCMAACPYSTRFFNWSHPVQSLETANKVYSPERSFPRKMGTVEKCDFCPEMIRKGKMPSCVDSCPMNAIYFGDQNEDAVTNSAGVTTNFSQLLEDGAGYRQLEELGTKPRVYYLPPKNRRYPKPEMNIDDNEKEKVKTKETDMKNMEM